MARIDGEYVINPTFAQVAQADLDIIVGATYENIMMVEGEMKEVSEEVMLGALRVAHDEIKKHCLVQKELMELTGKTTKRTYCHEVNDEDLRAAVKAATYDAVYSVARSQSGKHERVSAFQEICANYLETLPEDERDAKAPLVKKYFHDVEKEAMRNMILNEGVRLDGRKTNEIRPIWCEVDYLPAAHGSAVFTRGETQSLTLSLWEPRWMRKCLTKCSSRVPRSLCFTTISRLSPLEKPVLQGVFPAGRLVTEIWPIVL